MKEKLIYPTSHYDFELGRVPADKVSCHAHFSLQASLEEMAPPSVLTNAHPLPLPAENGTVTFNEGLADTAPPSHNYPKSNITLEDRFIDEPQRLRVAVIGGGLAGILAGILFPAKVPGIDLVIYEKNPDVVSLSRSMTLVELTGQGRYLAGEHLSWSPL